MLQIQLEKKEEADNNIYDKNAEAERLQIKQQAKAETAQKQEELKKA